MGLLLDDTECDNLDRILYECNGVLNKYIIINELLYFDEADIFCRNELGTNLASIHSFHITMKLFCAHIRFDCWIELNYKMEYFHGQTALRLIMAMM